MGGPDRDKRQSRSGKRKKTPSGPCLSFRLQRSLYADAVARYLSFKCLRRLADKEWARFRGSAGGRNPDFDCSAQN